MPRTKKQIQSVKGMHDILPEEQPWFDYVLKKGREILEDYGFSRIETPVLEYTELFEKGVGLGTDIVEKEMYSFKTRGGDQLTLRPEGTVPIVRAFIENGMQSLPQPIKLWYFSPMFRHEQPQAGRYRQFWQLGVELIGDFNPSSDAEIIFILYKLLQELGFKDLVFQINSIGDENCRPEYKKVLKNFYRSKIKRVCASCRVRFRKNILRMLDCGNEGCKEILKSGPQIVDFLDEECKEHFKTVLEFLDEIEVPYILNPFLVRGLDYYNRTIFEVKDESEIQLAGGGRYDKLIELLGGTKFGAVGWAIGVDRVIIDLKKIGIKLPKTREKPKIFLVQLGELAKKKSLILFEEFRKAGINIQASFSRDSIKSQLRIANKLGVRFTLIFGQREALDGNIILRDMGSSVQEIIPIEKIIEEVKKRLKEI